MAGLCLSRLSPGSTIISHLIDDTVNLADLMDERHVGEYVRPASIFREQTLALVHGGGAQAGAQPGAQPGALLPWTKTHSRLRLREGEVTLWHGQNFSGKSLLTGQVALDLCWQGYRVCIASLEMPPVKTLQRMCRQAWGIDQPSAGAIQQFHDWSEGRLWLYHRRGQLDWQRLVAVIRTAADRYDIQHFFIDSLMKCVRAEDDYNGQKDFVGALCAAAMDIGIHIHLVHHTAKPKPGENPLPGRYDAKGSGSISDQVDNVAGIWRNRGDRKGGDAPDCVLNWDKQRGGEWDGKVALWYDPVSFQYRGERLGVVGREYLQRRGAGKVDASGQGREA